MKRLLNRPEPWMLAIFIIAALLVFFCFRKMMQDGLEKTTAYIGGGITILAILLFCGFCLNLITKIHTPAPAVSAEQKRKQHIVAIAGLVLTVIGLIVAIVGVGHDIFF